MSGCERARELLSAQLDDQLQAGEEEQLLGHLASCSACQRQRQLLSRTVGAVRGAGGDLFAVSLPVDAFDLLTERLLAEDGARDPCAVAREQLSAEHDGELGEGEEAGLVEHLTGCGDCQAYRSRLRRTVERVRGAAVVLAPAGDDALAALAARLAPEGAEHEPELELADPTEGQLRLVAPEPDDRAAAGPEAWTPPARQRLEPKPREAQVIQLQRRLIKLAIAAAILGAATMLAYERFPQLMREMAGFTGGETPDAQEQPWVPPETPSPEPDPTPAPEDPPTPPPTPEVEEPTAPAGDPRDPTPEDPEVEGPEQPAEPEGEPEPAGPDPIPQVEPPETRVREPAVALDPDAMERVHRQIASAQLPPEQRPHLLESLGERRFALAANVAFLGDVLAGGLDRLPDPDGSRQQAAASLAALQMPEAALALARAPLRAERVYADEVLLLSALCQLESPQAVAALGTELAEGKPDEARAFLLVEALESIAEPPAYAGLLATYVERRRSPALRRVAAVALGRLGDPRAADPLRAGLEDRRAMVRQGSALALGELAARAPSEAPACVAALSAALEDKEPRVVAAAVEGLMTARHPDALGPLMASLEAKDRRLRTRARSALYRLAGKAGSTLRTPAQWRAFWAERRADRPDALFAEPDEVGDPKAYRRAVAESRAVVFVVDASGSMFAKWDAVVYELQEMLERCPPEVRFQVLFFSQAPRPIWRGMPPATRANQAKAIEVARQQSVPESGKTDIGKALDLALSHPGAETLVLISDGLESQVDEQVLQRKIQRLNRKRPQPARIHTVHIRFGGGEVAIPTREGQPDDPEDMRFMRALAADNGGLYAHN